MRRNTVAKLAIMLVVLSVTFSVPGAAKGKDEEFTRIYDHTYDEVFQASQETIARMGFFVTGKDKDKGTISGNGKRPSPNPYTVFFDIHVEALNTKPETRVTINNVKVKGSNFICPGCKSGNENWFKNQFSIELQKVLATYH